MPLRTCPHDQIVTRDRHGKENGYLIPIFNIHDGFISPSRQPQQVYLTVAEPGCIKGPHLHLKRWGYFTCIQGNVKIVTRVDDVYEEYFSGENHNFATIEVPAGIPAALQNIGEKPAMILNTPCPAWHPEDQDEHPVVFDDYSFS